MSYPARPTKVYYDSMKLSGWPENLPHRGICVLLAVLLASAAFPLTADSQTSSPVSRYLAARQQLDPIIDISPQALASFDESLSGMVLELRGEIVAVVTPTQDATDPPSSRILLQTDGRVTVALDYRQSDMQLTVGQRVSVLARMPEASQNCEHLQIEHIIAEQDLPGVSDSGAAEPDESASHQQDEDPPTNNTATASDTAEVALPPKSVPADLYAPDRLQAWQTWIARHNSNLSHAQRELIIRWVLYHAYNYGVDHRLIFSVILAESNFDPNSRSHAGAQGLMQLMPGTARGLGVADGYYIPENIRGGVEYLAKYLRQYRDETNYRQCALALACYNAGPNAVKKYGGVPPFPETRRYVIKVTQQFHDLYEAGYP